MENMLPYFRMRSTANSFLHDKNRHASSEKEGAECEALKHKAPRDLIPGRSAWRMAFLSVCAQVAVHSLIEVVETGDKLVGSVVVDVIDRAAVAVGGLEDRSTGDIFQLVQGKHSLFIVGNFFDHVGFLSPLGGGAFSVITSCLRTQYNTGFVTEQAYSFPNRRTAEPQDRRTPMPQSGTQNA